MAPMMEPKSQHHGVNEVTSLRQRAGTGRGACLGGMRSTSNPITSREAPMRSPFLRVVRPVATIVTFALISTAAACRNPAEPTSSTTTTTTTTTGTASTTAPFILLRPPTTNAAFARANGEAKFENQGGERELEIEVEDIPAGTQLVFYLGDTEIARATANSFGNARINLNSDRGATVPSSVAGKTVVVKTPAGAVVVSGSF